MPPVPPAAHIYRFAPSPARLYSPPRLRQRRSIVLGHLLIDKALSFVMKLSRRDPYRPRRHPVVFLGWIGALLLVALLVLSWWKGGEKPLGEVEIAIPAEKLGG